ncbi:MAG: ribonuclease PH [Myxococcota bacterium]
MTPIMRQDGRKPQDLRSITFQKRFIEHHPGSVLVCYGKTKVVVTATISNQLPQHRKEIGKGWLSAEYGMLPGSTHDRKSRPGPKGPDGRSIEIQRLIGRALRQAVDIDQLGPRAITVDCDVLQADGGTRTAAITGGWVAIALLLKQLRLDHLLVRQVAAVSIGIKGEQVLTDINYEEDVSIDTDFNLVACQDGTIVELQGAAEGNPMKANLILEVLRQGLPAIAQICRLQLEAIQ